LTEEDEELVAIVLGLLPFRCPVKPRQQVLGLMKKHQPQQVPFFLQEQLKEAYSGEQQGEKQRDGEQGQEAGVQQELEKGQQQGQQGQVNQQRQDGDLALHLGQPIGGVWASEPPPADVVHSIVECIERGKVDLVKLVAGSGYSRSALAMAVAEQQRLRHPLYVSLRGLFAPEDVEAAVMRGVFDEGYDGDCHGERLLLANLKLLACSSKRPLLLVLDEVDFAATYRGGSRFRELLLQLRLVVPHMLLFVSSSVDPGGSWLDDSLLMYCQQEQQYKLPDAAVRLVCYRQLATIQFRDVMDLPGYQPAGYGLRTRWH
jgi:hypothetical protein